MELKRAAELVLCDLLKEQLSDLIFLPHKGGGGDPTPIWRANFDYELGDILRPTNLAYVHAVVIEAAGNSGPTQPAFSDTVGELFTGPPNYRTIAPLAVAAKPVDSGSPMPPFATIQIEDGEKTVSYEETDLLKGKLRWLTRADSSNVVTHSLNFKRIYDAMSQIGYGYDYLRRINVHGVDIYSTSDYVDEARQAHGDVINFTMGVSERSFTAS